MSFDRPAPEAHSSPSLTNPEQEAGGARPAPPADKPPLRRALVFLGIGVILAALLGYGLFTGRGDSKGGPPTTGDPVPAFTLARLGGGGSVSVPRDGGGRGHPAVLVFFASWCTPCQKEVPALARVFSEEQANRSRLAKVTLIGVDGSDPASAALGFVQRAGVTFAVGVDPTYQVTQGKFGFNGLPETVFVEANGTIAGIHYGALSAAALKGWQRRLQSA